MADLDEIISGVTRANPAAINNIGSPYSSFGLGLVLDIGVGKFHRCGGLLAACAERGAHVSLLCMTRGEAGPSTPATGHGPDTLASRRTEEIRAASTILGIHDVTVLDHEDGMLPWTDTVRLDRDILTDLPDLPNIVAFRNRLIHGYDTVDDSIVWNIAQEELPILEASLRQWLRAHGDL